MSFKDEKSCFGNADIVRIDNIPLHGNFGNCGPVALSKPIWVKCYTLPKLHTIKLPNLQQSIICYNQE